MDDDWLTGGMRSLVADAVAEAAKRGTATVEAEHVLLALLADSSAPLALAWAAAGLDYAKLDAALVVERTNSLAAAGVTPIDSALLASTARVTKPSWGASVAAARARAHAAPVTRSLSSRTRAVARTTDIAAAIVAAPLGTVARALSYAALDRAELERCLTTALPATSPA